MVRFVMQEWLANHADQTLQVLSLPCSTGEEPYTVVMALMDAGYPLHRLHVDAIDISQNALQRARAGVYRPYSFRNKDKRFQKQYFVEETGGYRLKQALREPVVFHHTNALELRSFCLPEQYDVIFCRNLLIYLDGPAQKKIISDLMYCLNPAGRLFSSPAEYSLYRDSEFESLGMPGVSKFHRPAAASKAWESRPDRKPESRSTQVTTAAAARKVALRKSGLPKAQPALSQTALSQTALSQTALGQSGATGLVSSVPTVPTPAVPTPSEPAPAVPTPAEPAPAVSAPDLLSQAAALADAGRLDEAAAICERHMGQAGESAEGMYLWGLIKDTLGDSQEAERLYRKALYLDPNHAEALLQLASLRADAKDEAGAKLLRARARRAQENQG